MGKFLPHFTLAGLAIVLSAIFPSGAQAEIKIEGKPRWGFDGTVRVEEFNLLTFEIFNDSDKPWQGTVSVVPMQGLQTVDVPVVQPDLFIEPYGTRSLQYYLFLPDTTEYEISWASDQGGWFRKEGRLEIDSPQTVDDKLTIQIVNEGQGRSTPETPAFAAENWPSSAVVLQALEGIVLESAPAWQNPQQQAFLDWLYGGGTLYLPNTSSGERVSFQGGLSVLNEPSDSFPVGYGRVVRERPPTPEKKEDPAKNSHYKMLSTSGTIFTVLKLMTTPEHNWGLIYSLAVIYLLVLFPGGWLLGRKKGDFRITYAVILGTVALFSYGFHTIGKRGYGEETTINSVAIVKPGQAERWLVKQWSNVFITSGSNYLVEYELDSSAIATGQQHESIRGMAINQPTGILQTDIPAFSNRSVINSGILKTKGFRPELKSLKADVHLIDFVVSLPEGQSWSDTKTCYAIYHGMRYAMKKSGNQLQKDGAGMPMTDTSFEALAFNPYTWGYDRPESSSEMYEWATNLSFADDLRHFYGSDDQATKDGDDLVHLYIPTEMGQEFFAQGDLSPQQQGVVVYAFQFDPKQNN